MHLVINGSDIGRRRGGNESYLLGLLQGLAEPRPPARIDVLVTSAGAAVLRAAGIDRFDLVPLGAYHRLFFFMWQQTALLRKLSPDWYLSTFFLPPVTPCRAAVLVHDLSFRAHPEYFPFFIAHYMRVLTGLAVRRADIVVALSEFTRKELARYHPSAVEKSVVVYPGVERRFQRGGVPDESALPAWGPPPGYILAVGNIHPRKNLGRLLDAYLLLRTRRAHVPPLVWVGSERWGSGALIQRARAAGVILPGFVAPEDLPTLYRQAVMLVYPSLYEGFGLPPLEAMACGTPVVTSDATSLPEAVGEAALKVDATDIEALAQGVERLLDDGVLREQLRQAGVSRAGLFQWTDTARNLLTALGAKE